MEDLKDSSHIADNLHWYLFSFVVFIRLICTISYQVQVSQSEWFTWWIWKYPCGTELNCCCCDPHSYLYSLQYHSTTKISRQILWNIKEFLPFNFPELRNNSYKHIVLLSKLWRASSPSVIHVLLLNLTLQPVCNL